MADLHGEVWDRALVPTVALWQVRTVHGEELGLRAPGPPAPFLPGYCLAPALDLAALGLRWLWPGVQGAGGSGWQRRHQLGS